MQTVQLQNINGLSILSRLDKIEKGIEKISTTNDAPSLNLLTRKQVAEQFGVSTVTVWDWTKKNILKAYKIANKVYYKRPEIEKALIQISGK